MTTKLLTATISASVVLAATAFAESPNDVAVAILSPENNATITTCHVRVSGTANSPAGIALVFVNGVQACGTTNWCASVPVNPGSNFIVAVAMDNEHANGMDRIVVLGAGEQPPQDRIPPAITDIAPPSGFTTNDAVALLITALDNVAVVAVKVNNQPALALGNDLWSFNAPLRPGDNKFELVALDGAGNCDRAMAVYFRTCAETNDNIPPTITAVEPPGGQTTNAVVEMLITAIDNVGVTAVKVNGHPATALGADQWSYRAVLCPGDNLWQIAAGDAARNIGHAEVTYIRTTGDATDTVPPVITEITPPSGVVNGRDVEMLIAAVDNVGVTRVQVEDKSAQCVGSNLWAFRAHLEHGQTMLHVFAFDAAGNVGHSGVAYVLDQGPTNDMIPPCVVKIEPPAGAASTNVVNMLITAIDNIGVTAVKVNEAAATMLSSTQWTYCAQLRPGQNAFHVDAFDAAGNVGRAGVGYFLGAPCSNDLHRPVITEVQPHSGVTTNDAVDLLITAWDDVGVVSVMVNSNRATQVASNLWACHMPLACGPNNFMINAFDADGKAAMARVGYLRVAPDGLDCVPPQILSVCPHAGVVTNSPLSIVIIAADNVGVTSVTVNDGAASALGSNHYACVLALAAGTNVVTVIARDAAANAATATVVYVYRAGDALAAPLALRTTSDELTGYLNKPYNKLLEAEGGDGTYFWTVNGLKPNLVSTPDGEITGIPIVPGQHSVAIVISNAGQTFSTNLLMTILDEPASATIISDKSADAIALQPYAAALALAGTPNVEAWQFEALGGLPTGLILQPDGRLSGTPRSAGAYALLIRATHANTSVTKTIPLNVVAESAGALGTVTLDKMTMKLDWARPLADKATAVLTFILPRDADPLQQQWIVNLGNYPVPLENPVSAAHGALIAFANHPSDARSLAISAKARINGQGRVRLTVSVRNAAMAAALGVQDQSVRRGASCLPATLKIGTRAGHAVRMLRQDGVAGRASYLRTVR